MLKDNSWNFSPGFKVGQVNKLWRQAAPNINNSCPGENLAGSTGNSHYLRTQYTVREFTYSQKCIWNCKINIVATFTFIHGHAEQQNI